MPVSREERTIVLSRSVRSSWMARPLLRGERPVRSRSKDIFPEGNAFRFVFLQRTFSLSRVGRRSPVSGFLREDGFFSCRRHSRPLRPLRRPRWAPSSRRSDSSRSGLSGGNGIPVEEGHRLRTLPMQEAAHAYVSPPFSRRPLVLLPSAWNGAPILLPFAGPVVTAVLLSPGHRQEKRATRFRRRSIRRRSAWRFAQFLTTAYILYGLGSGMFSLLTPRSPPCVHKLSSWPGRGAARRPRTTFRDIPGTSSPFILLSLSRGSELLLLPLARLWESPPTC
jgi:hypothetical protein